MADSWEQVESAELAQMAALGAEARRRWFAERPHLRRSELAWRLAVESGRAVRVDLEAAAALANASRWLALELGDAAASARSQRATANVLYFQRRFEAAARAYEEALAGFEEVGDELEAAITRTSAIGSLSHLARYERALEFAASARQVYEKREDRLHLGRLEIGVGHVLSRQDRFQEAIEHYKAALDFYADGVGQPVDIATALRNIAVCYQDLNDFHASLDAYSAARDYCREHGMKLVGLEVEYNLAYIYFLRGQYSQAIHLFEEARRHSSAQGDPHHAALCDLDLAEIFLELNLVQDAEHLARRAFEAFADLGMKYETAKALAFQALASARQKEWETALGLLQQARRLFQRQGNHVWVAMVALHEALTLFAAGRLEEALIGADAASAGFRDSSVPSRQVPCEILRARLAAGLGDLAAAKRRCAVALELAQQSGRPQLEFQALLACGQIAEAEGDPLGALASYRRSHEALESLRGQLQTDELKIAFTDDKRAVYEGLVEVTLAGDADNRAIDAFNHVETAKSRALSDLLAFGSPVLGRPTSEANPLVAELAELRQEVNWYYRQISAEELLGGEASHARLAALRQKVRRREQRLLRVVRRLHASDADLSLLPGSSTADLDAVLAVLPDESALVEYFFARGSLYRFQLDRSGIDAVRLGSVAKVRQLYRQLRFQLGKFRVGGDYIRRYGEMFQGQALSLLQDLERELLGGWRPPEGTRHLIVVPHDFLHHVPFHALYDGERFLIDELSISYAPSATVFRLCRQRPDVSTDRSLVMGVSDERAPRILDEARAVAEILPGSKLLIGEEATRDSLTRYGNGCRFVHLATHGLYRRDNPMFSALQLGDTRMSLLDLYDLKLEVGLAVLSGCGTGLSDVQGSDELVGLTRGLLTAGARSVVAALWDVDDDSTAEFMQLFYRGSTGGETPARALQQAMVRLRGDRSHPYYWAPFVLIGSY